jgi:DNA repair exonuclease SbcCD ATPase subunit
MALWNRDKLLKQKDEIIDWYKQKERECRTDLERKDRLIRELEQKKAEYERLLEQKQTEYNTSLKQIEQEYRTDLEQKDRLIRELEQIKAEYEKLLEQKQTEYNTSLKQKEEEWNRRLMAASSVQASKPVPHPQHHPSQSPTRTSNTMQGASSHFRMMQRLARQQQSSPRPSSFHQLQTSRRQTTGAVTFNPLKYQHRG